MTYFVLLLTTDITNDLLGLEMNRKILNYYIKVI